MDRIIGVRFTTAGPIDYCDSGDLDIGIGDYIIIRKNESELLGWVVLTNEQIIASSIDQELLQVERFATEEDIESWRQQKTRGEEDIGRAQGLAMRISPGIRVAAVDYDLSGDNCKVSISNFDDAELEVISVEFGTLLGSKIQIIEVNQRERAKAMGAGVMGLCGRDLCCTSWMTQFPTVSIRMAKEQGLSPDPSRISGLCGRLLCCLTFEVEEYRQLRGVLPEVGEFVTTPVGRAKVYKVDLLSNNVQMRLELSGEIINMAADQISEQYGTMIRPEKLDEAVEKPARESATKLKEATIAILEPVDYSSNLETTDSSKDIEKTIAKRRRGKRGGKRNRKK